MPAQTSFWQRIGNMLRGLQGPGAGRNKTNGNGHAYAFDSEPGPDATVPGAGSTAGVESDASRPLARSTRREPTIAQMRDGYQRVTELMDAMELHFRQQDARGEQLGAAVDRMATTLEQLKDTGCTQQDHIRTIADHVSEAGKHTALMSESLRQMPRSLQLQAEAVRTMLQQMEISQEADTQLMHSLQQLSRAVEGLSTSATAQVQTLERLHAAEREQKEGLTMLVCEQGRRFVFIIIVAAVLGLGALASLAAVLLTLLRT
jgi:hypothetical protein